MSKEKTWPQDGDYYWFINTFDGSYVVSEWQNSHMDKLLLSLGNIYRTQEEAINKRVYMMTDKAQKIARLNILIKELTEGEFDE